MRRHPWPDLGGFADSLTVGSWAAAAGNTGSASGDAKATIEVVGGVAASENLLTTTEV